MRGQVLGLLKDGSPVRVGGADEDLLRRQIAQRRDTLADGGGRALLHPNQIAHHQCAGLVALLKRDGIGIERL